MKPKYKSLKMCLFLPATACKIPEIYLKSHNFPNPVQLTAVAEVAGVVLRLVVDPHVVGDVSSRQQLPTDVTRHLLLVPDQMSAETIPRGKRRRACLCKT